MSQISNPSEAFEVVANQFDAERARGVVGTVQLEVSGEGKWAVEIADGTYNLVDGGVDTPTTTLRMNREDFLGIVNGTLKVMDAFLQGRISLQGDMDLALKFQSIFGLS